MENARSTALALTSADPQLLRPIPAGTCVRLPDGETGYVEWSSYAEVHVVQPQRILGRGPWIFHRSQVEAL